MNPTKAIQKPNLSWISWYEQLRSEVLQPSRLTSNQGMAIFQNRGLVGWQRIISEMAFTYNVGDSNVNTECLRQIEPLPAEAQSNLVQALATLIASQLQGGRS